MSYGRGPVWVNSPACVGSFRPFVNEHRPGFLARKVINNRSTKRSIISTFFNYSFFVFHFSPHNIFCYNYFITDLQ